MSTGMNTASFCLALFAAAFLCGCEDQESPPSTDMPVSGVSEVRDQTLADRPSSAIARLNPTLGNQVRGAVTFVPANATVQVTAHIEGLTPGPHGFHIHEKGDCSAPDASSAGNHFNPLGMPHGGPGAHQRHIGDLGNLTADADGRAHIEFEDSLIALEGTHSILGRAVVVHEQADDLTSQPAGNSGQRLACGVIERR